MAINSPTGGILDSLFLYPTPVFFLAIFHSFFLFFFAEGGLSCGSRLTRTKAQFYGLIYPL